MKEFEHVPQTDPALLRFQETRRAEVGTFLIGLVILVVFGGPLTLSILGFPAFKVSGDAPWIVWPCDAAVFLIGGLLCVGSFKRLFVEVDATLRIVRTNHGAVIVAGKKPVGAPLKWRTFSLKAKPQLIQYTGVGTGGGINETNHRGPWYPTSHVSLSFKFGDGHEKVELEKYSVATETVQPRENLRTDDVDFDPYADTECARAAIARRDEMRAKIMTPFSFDDTPMSEPARIVDAFPNEKPVANEKLIVRIGFANAKAEHPPDTLKELVSFDTELLGEACLTDKALYYRSLDNSIVRLPRAELRGSRALNGYVAYRFGLDYRLLVRESEREFRAVIEAKVT